MLVFDELNQEEGPSGEDVGEIEGGQPVGLDDDVHLRDASVRHISVGQRSWEQFLVDRVAAQRPASGTS